MVYFSSSTTLSAIVQVTYGPYERIISFSPFVIVSPITSSSDGSTSKYASPFLNANVVAEELV